MQLFNQFSYVIFMLAALVGVILLLRWRGIQPRGLLVAGGLFAALALGGFFILRPVYADVASIEEADVMLTNGHPTFIEFYSPYCIGCMAVRSSTDDLVAEVKQQVGDALNVLRVDIHTAPGLALRERFHFTSSPEFVILDGAGQEQWRGHRLPDPAQLIALADAEKP
jgi:thiol-disulfide isomerase/thioredoxin